MELSKPLNGKKSVKVKCLPVRKLDEFRFYRKKRRVFRELATELSAEEVDMLSTEDSGRIFEKVHELNFDPFSAWLKRKGKAAEMQAQAYGVALPKDGQPTDGGKSASSPDGLPQTQG